MKISNAWFHFFAKKKRGFIAVHSLPKKVSIQTPWTIPGKQLRVFYFPPEKHSNGRNQIFSLEKKNHMWSTLIKNMYLIKFDQIICGGRWEKNNKMFFPKKNRNGWQKNTTTKQNKKTYELLHCSCLSKLKSWPRKPLRFLRRDNKLLKLFVVHLCFWGQINHMYVAWKEQKRTSTCFWQAQILLKNAFHMDPCLLGTPVSLQEYFFGQHVTCVLFWEVRLSSWKLILKRFWEAYYWGNILIDASSSIDFHTTY